MKLWEIQRTEYKISDFINWKENGLLDLNPKYQRRSVWDSKKKSYLIDTIIRGLPIPIIFIRQQEPDLETLKQVREVVDGQQRLRTVLSFIKPDLLNDYKKDRDQFLISRVHNKDLANKPFSQLPSSYRTRILDYQFSVHVLPSDVDDKELLQIFSRLNSTGIKLNHQELRNATYFGVFKSSVYGQAITYLDRWKKWKIFNDTNIARMEEVELTSELYSLMIDGIKAKTQPSLDNLYKKYDEDCDFSDELETRFQLVMELIDDLLGNSIQDTLFSNKTIFYILFGLFYDLSYGLKSELKPTKAKPIDPSIRAKLVKATENIRNGSAPVPVLEASARRTTHISSRNDLIDYFKQSVES